MRFALAVLSIVALAGPGGAALAQSERPTSADAATIEELTVIGRYPGPPLWKVTSGQRTLWIFGELSPVPKGLDWDPRNAERVLERADAVIAAPRISAPTFNPFRILRLLRDARRLARIEKGKTLADVLPPELDARYVALRARYKPDDKRSDELRPALAALRLYGAALDTVGLTANSNVGSKVKRLMRKSQGEETAPKIKTEPEAVLDALGKIPREAELRCVAALLTSMETDLEGMKERANAWAVGDVAALRRFDYPDPQGDCLAMLVSSNGLADLRNELYAMWLAEAERALATHGTTFSVLPMRELIAADGLLAKLAERGYVVTAP
jgi:uncharacterized protein YbaP (TraB family)